MGVIGGMIIVFSGLMYISPIQAVIKVQFLDGKLVTRIDLFFIWRLLKIHRVFDSDHLLGSNHERLSGNEAPSLEQDGQRLEHTKNSLKQYVAMTRRMVPIILKFFKKVHLQSIRWESRYGARDADRTAFFYGLLWQWKSIVYWVLHLLVTLDDKKPVLNVQADWSKPGFTTELSCIVQVRTGDAIIAGINVWRIVKKRKGCDKPCKTTPFKGLWVRPWKTLKV